MSDDFKKINLGGGSVKMDGYTNIDVLKLPNVDIVADLSKGIPLASDSIDEVYSAHFLEHLDDVVFIMSEIYRVCRNQALVRIKVPYFKSIGAFKDPTHKSFFTEATFEYFDKDFIESGVLSDYQLDVHMKLEKISYIWSSWWIRYLPAKKFFLKHFWNIARSMYVELRVIKNKRNI